MCVSVVRTFKIYFRGKFQVYNTALLPIDIMLYIRATELTHLTLEVYTF